MAKRHHHSSSSSVSSHRDKHGEGNSYKMGGYYEGAEPRRRQEMEDAGMIREDHSAIANLPQNVSMKPYPKEGGYLPEDLDDTLRGIDRQMGFDNRKKMEHFYPKKV
jgi:hypothetical protein